MHSIMCQTRVPVRVKEWFLFFLILEHKSLSESKKHLYHIFKEQRCLVSLHTHLCWTGTLRICHPYLCWVFVFRGKGWCNPPCLPGYAQAVGPTQGKCMVVLTSLRFCLGDSRGEASAQLSVGETLCPLSHPHLALKMSTEPVLRGHRWNGGSITEPQSHL